MYITIVHYSYDVYNWLAMGETIRFIDIECLRHREPRKWSSQIEYIY